MPLHPRDKSVKMITKMGVVKRCWSDIVLDETTISVSVDGTLTSLSITVLAWTKVITYPLRVAGVQKVPVFIHDIHDHLNKFDGR